MPQQPSPETMRTMRTLRLCSVINYAAIWLCIIVLTIFSEVDIMPTGYLKPDASLLYGLQMLCILLTLGSVWGALRLPVMKRVRRLCEQHPQQHYMMAIVRMDWLAVAVFVDLLIYYALPADQWSFYCLLIGLVGLIFCYPSAPREAPEDRDDKARH